MYDCGRANKPLELCLKSLPLRTYTLTRPLPLHVWHINYGVIFCKKLYVVRNRIMHKLQWNQVQMVMIYLLFVLFSSILSLLHNCSECLTRFLSLSETRFNAFDIYSMNDDFFAFLGISNFYSAHSACLQNGLYVVLLFFPLFLYFY